ncbi:lipid IV(A) 3-deoxy-D-manno-octulosonic acid transferase [Pararhizobium mangrovi]|uniref:lipid IV(A) 3-deoxy-D-manno-octulosonic acid transferase n=1 Tax=Pararhizobium mangrovi TaxID=2590452 RepID=UPI0022A70397|nr:lipid IV(A) 3-deoxy-D-manno-octulosonic acid transferase [Pararhizobium mangrovi]
MRIGWTRLALGGYRLLGRVATPLALVHLARRARLGKEERSRRGERFGRAGVARPDGPLVWFHAASVGETNAVAPLVEAVHRRGIAVLLTTGTVTSAQIAAERLSGRAIHQYVPLDLAPAVTRFLGHWQPDLAVFVESEIWPTTIRELGARKTPHILVNGRLSDRSFASWHRRHALAEALFGTFAHVAAQSELDAERFERLGAPSVSVTGNIKIDGAAPPCDTEKLDALRKAIGERATWAAISTFEGEEEIAAGVHASVKEKRADMLTIVVPRHPERGDAIARMLGARGLSVVRHSRGERPKPETDILLGDTIGEMGLYLRLTGIAFVGRSIAEKGGQNPIEPAVLGCAVLTGRNVQNFRETYRALVEAGGAKIVRDEAMLAEGVAYLLANPAERTAMARAGRVSVDTMRGALQRTLSVLEPHLAPLAVKARLAPAQADDDAVEARG